MSPLVLHDVVARDLLDWPLLGWAGIELGLWLRNRGGQTAADWTLIVVVGSVVAGINLGYRAAHVPSTVLGGGWAPVAIGLPLLLAGIGLRVAAILVLGRLFKFAVVIQPDHRVIQWGPYRLLRHPSYAGGLVALLGAGIMLDNWLSVVALVMIPLLGVLLRIRVEEAMLDAALGGDYGEYKARTYRLIPWVW